MGWIRMQIDKVLLSDHEWKKKYCPNMYAFLFGGQTPEDRASCEGRNKKEVGKW